MMLTNVQTIEVTSNSAAVVTAKKILASGRVAIRDAASVLAVREILSVLESQLKKIDFEPIVNDVKVSDFERQDASNPDEAVGFLLPPRKSPQQKAPQPARA